MNEMRKIKVEDSRLFLGTLQKEIAKENAKEIAFRIAFLKAQAEPLKELPERLSHQTIFRIGYMKRMALKILNFLSREERRNIRVAAESLELIISIIESKRDGK